MIKLNGNKFYFSMIINVFVSVAIMGCPINVAFAENPSVIGNWNMTKETSYPSTCEEPQIELFSCRLISAKIVSLCMNKKTRSLEFRINKEKDKTDVMMLSSATQVISAASAGGATILSGKTHGGDVTLFLDNNYADDSGSAVIFPGQSAVGCIHNSIRDPIHIIYNIYEPITIWSLLPLGITMPFFNEIKDQEIREKKMKKLWLSWPE
ncbi:hypothetical protein [Dickeya fangzhongdai]|uniref:hypothetical protein n=1 Tax=Dickeya fangzhongdai TaxID=1778540 RepID=UPI000675FAAE|nr:hypothetical protein [Dickeya fangzhongdai]